MQGTKKKTKKKHQDQKQTTSCSLRVVKNNNFLCTKKKDANSIHNGKLIIENHLIQNDFELYI